MSEKTSRIILIIEAVLIVLPITGLAVFEAWLTLEPTAHWRIDYIYSKILVLLCLVLIAAGWRLFSAFLRGGANNLQKIHSGWWLMLLIGVLIFVGTLISISLPRTAGPSAIEEIQFILRTFIFASPLLIPLIHLALEKFTRKPTGEIAK
jgi:hypothetical protein